VYVVGVEIKLIEWRLLMVLEAGLKKALREYVPRACCGVRSVVVAAPSCVRGCDLVASVVHAVSEVGMLICHC